MKLSYSVLKQQHSHRVLGFVIAVKYLQKHATLSIKRLTSAITMNQERKPNEENRFPKKSYLFAQSDAQFSPRRYHRQLKLQGVYFHRQIFMGTITHGDDLPRQSRSTSIPDIANSKSHLTRIIMRRKKDVPFCSLTARTKISASDNQKQKTILRK